MILKSVVFIVFRCEYVVKCNTMWKLARDVSANEPPVTMLSGGARRHLYKALVLAGSGPFEGNHKEDYWQMVSRRSCR